MPAWDSSRAHRYLAIQEQNDLAFAPFDDALVAVTKSQPGYRILDVGCGAGSTLRVFARAVGRGGHITGVDIAEPMAQAAREAAAREGLRNTTTLCADVQTVALDDSFDVVVSRLGVMFFDDFEKAFANIRRMLRSGGALAFVCWQTFEKSLWYEPYQLLTPYTDDVADPSTDDPFRLSDPRFITEVLQAAGYADISIIELEYRLTIGGGGSLEQAFEHFVATRKGSAFNSLDPDKQALARKDIFGFLEDHQTAHGVEVPASAWLVSAVNPHQRK